MKAIQITDTHLFAQDEMELFGVKSNIKFNEVINKIIDEDLNDADVIFLTGDISQDETLGAYQKAVNILDQLNIPIYWIPGNHDDTNQMELVFKNSQNFIQTRYLSLSGWNFIFLNTKMGSDPEGFLPKSELEALKQKISNGDKKIAVVMHHHPAPVGTPLVDNYILKNKDEFWSVVANSEIELIICGHVHGNYTVKNNNIMIETSPATCLQWQQGTIDLKIDPRIGYKIYYFDQYSYKAVSKLW